MTRFASRKGIGTLIHEDVPRWNTASKIGRVPWVLLGLWFPVRAVQWLVSGHVASGIVYVILAVTYCVCLYAFLAPRRYQILDDRVRIVFVRPFAINIPLSRIKGVRQHSLWGLEHVVSYAHCTSSECVEMLGHTSSTFISPANRDLFMQRLNEALDKTRTENHG